MATKNLPSWFSSLKPLSLFIPSINTISYLDNTYGKADLLSKGNGLCTDLSSWSYWKEVIGKHQEPWYCSRVCSARISNKLFENIKKYVSNNKYTNF